MLRDGELWQVICQAYADSVGDGVHEGNSIAVQVQGKVGTQGGPEALAHCVRGRSNNGDVFGKHVAAADSRVHVSPGNARKDVGEEQHGGSECPGHINAA